MRQTILYSLSIIPTNTWRYESCYRECIVCGISCTKICVTPQLPNIGLCGRCDQRKNNKYIRCNTANWCYDPPSALDIIRSSNCLPDAMTLAYRHATTLSMLGMLRYGCSSSCYGNECECGVVSVRRCDICSQSMSSITRGCKILRKRYNVYLCEECNTNIQMRVNAVHAHTNLIYAAVNSASNGDIARYVLLVVYECIISDMLRVRYTA